MEQILKRHEARENAFIAAFSATFVEDELQTLLAERCEDEEYPLDRFGEKLVRSYYDHSSEIDDLISERLTGWTINRLPRVSVTALRLALSEMLYGGENIPSVVIDEAVELVKKYGADGDYRFVNGVLGAVVRDLNLTNDNEE